ncbi:hypothetical protein [uncultured Roseibium sp.]|uniref:hypothetical protein n=1 Tax=uncultured Roseibium sp. TaxID=1936171 RepID=UPI00263115DB|nr:hypothetical protein [uncultured Roseibium sp.]
MDSDQIRFIKPSSLRGTFKTKDVDVEELRKVSAPSIYNDLFYHKALVEDAFDINEHALDNCPSPAQEAAYREMTSEAFDFPVGEPNPHRLGRIAFDSGRPIEQSHEVLASFLEDYTGVVINREGDKLTFTGSNVE